MPNRKEWFGEWFDSPYYHILYKNRDTEEAKKFIDRIIEEFNFTAENKILDIACGKGRHAIYLNERGFDVTGIDLSEANIEYASRFENSRLQFQVHDMRKTFKKDAFCFVLNLFTSFGYFEEEKENQQAIAAMAENLKPGGQLLLDFLNPYVVVNNLVSEEVKIIDGIEFQLNRKFENGFILKTITFEDEEKKYHFVEKVKGIRKTMFETYFEKAGLKILNTFGDYDLQPYHPEKSDRMIFHCIN